MVAMTELGDLAGKRALVTGASRGIGAALAAALAEQGVAVACAARSTADQPQRTPGTLDDTVARIRDAGGHAVAVPADLSDPDAVVAMVDVAAAELGGLDLLVNNAAVTFVGDLNIPLARHDLVLAVNLQAPLLALRAARTHLERSGGAVLNVSSVAALYPHNGLMSYGISKIGLERLTVDAARQLQAAGVAVNCFRIDVPVASEGFVANTPGMDRSSWEPCEVAAEGMVWMLRQPRSYTGRLESMFHLREREGIMATRITGPPIPRPPVHLWDGLAPMGDDVFREPHE